MLYKKKANTNKVNTNKKEIKGKEINLEDLNDISGGSISDVRYTETKLISKETQEKI
ncbi:MAG: hypothetical protein RSA27_03055 [Oscillospiraceae bacterium]